jgi:AcrR family transcriptional regulator
MGQRKRTGQARAAILEAGERIFADAGFGGARTDAIAAMAGVNKALLYYYFHSKDGLYRAILEDHLRDFHRQVVGALSAQGSARSKLLRYVSTHFDFISARPCYPRLVQRFIMTGGKPLERMAQEFYLPLLRKLKGVIDSGVRDGEFRPVDSHHAVLSLVALIVFYFSSAPVLNVVTHADPYGKVQLARRKESVLEFIRHALFTDRKDAGR